MGGATAAAPCSLLPRHPPTSLLPAVCCWVLTAICCWVLTAVCCWVQELRTNGKDADWAQLSTTAAGSFWASTTLAVKAMALLLMDEATTPAEKVNCRGAGGGWVGGWSW